MKVRPAARPLPGSAGEGALSLFPFLAVLVCTLGALILLLVLISRLARLQADRAAQAEQARQAADLEAEREIIDWRIEQLKASREKTQSQLTEMRHMLGHFEDHARRLSQEAARLERRLAEIDQEGSRDTDQRGRIEAELAAVRAELAAAQGALEDARREASASPRSYAVVPYRGPNGTFRRPIYIECRKDALVLQPEGVVFDESDFEEPLGPGNPLAAALRAAREYLLVHGGFDPRRDGEPYPLLLVRPDAVAAYYAARAALSSWGADFGYELIEQDWKLAYPPADAELAAVVRQAVDVARRRQERIAAAAPRSYGQRTRPTYRVSGGVGGVVVDEPGDNGGSPYRAGATARPYGDPGPTGGFSAPEAGRTGPPDPRAGGFAADGVDSSRRGGAPINSSAAVLGSNTTGGGSPAAPAGMTSSRYAPDGAPLGAPLASATNRAPSGHLPSSAGGGTPALSSGGRQTAAGADNPGSAELRLGEWQPREAAVAGAPAGAAADRVSSQSCPTESLTKKRGDNWGLPEAVRGSVPITRPIVVECHVDRIVLPAEPGMVGERTVMLGPRLVDSIDGLVAAVWDRTRSWGIAGSGMYWRPILRVAVAPGAEQRFEELRAVLEGSGLVVERKPSPAR